MATLELRPMGIGDILDATFRLYRDYFARYLSIALVVYVPFAVLTGVVQSFQPDPAAGPPDPTQLTGQLGLLIGSLGLYFLFAIIFLPLCNGALVHNISSAYLGEDLGTKDSYARAAPRLVRLILAQILVGLACMVGFVLCVVPGVIFMLWFMLTPTVVMLETRGAMASLERSRELMRGNLGKGFVLWLVIIILQMFVGGAAGAIVAVVPWPHMFFAGFFQTVLSAFIVPIQLAPLILLYYDLRIRKEAFDLEQLASSLGRPAEG